MNRGYELLYSLATMLKLKQLTADSPQTTSPLAKKLGYYIIISYLKVSEIINSCTASVADIWQILCKKQTLLQFGCQLI